MFPLLILAAGAASRMRGPDKLALKIDGVPLLRRQAMAAIAAEGGDFEVKFRGPDGVVFDISDHLWPGAEPVTAEERKLPISETEAAET